MRLKFTPLNRREGGLLVYVVLVGACFKILLPEVKIAWLLYLNLILLYSWPYLTRLILPKLNTDGERFLLFAYAAFLGACLLVVIPGKKLWILYASLIIPWSWRYLPEFLELVKVSQLYRLALLYLGYLLASMFWSPRIEAKAVLSTLACATSIAHFVLLTAGLRARYQDNFDYLLGKLCFLAAISATVVIATWYSQHPFPQSRMQGFGYLDNPIQGAAVFGVFLVIAWQRMIDCSPTLARFSYGLASTSLLTYACLSWTRSVLMAIGVSLAILTVKQLNRRTLIPLGIFGLAGLSLAGLSPELVAKLTRPEPYRPYIWLDAATQAIHHPWFGQGYFSSPGGTTKLADGSLYLYAHSHSFFIENLRTGGIVGLGLAIWLSAYSLYQAFKGGSAIGNLLPFALLLYGLLCIAPNGWLLLPGVRIKEVWVMFWFPLGLAISEELKSASIGVLPTLPKYCAAPDTDLASERR